MKSIFAALLFCTFFGTARADAPKDVSMIQLIADPQRFDGQTVRVMGFMRLEFEGNALYLHREDYERSILINGVWLSLTDEQLKAFQKLNNGYVLVEGVFSSTERGHLSIWQGSLQNITRLASWQRAGPPGPRGPAKTK